MNCSKVTCGQEKCLECVPLEQYLENVEKGRAENFRPIIGAVPSNFKLEG